MAKKFSELRTKLTSTERALSRARAKEIVVQGLTLRELREQCEVTQVDLAARAATTQSEISRVEQRADVMVSTLREYVRGLGAELELTARFPDGGTVRVQVPGSDGGASGAMRRLEQTTSRAR